MLCKDLYFITLLRFSLSPDMMRLYVADHHLLQVIYGLWDASVNDKDIDIKIFPLSLLSYFHMIVYYCLSGKPPVYAGI